MIYRAKVSIILDEILHYDHVGHRFIRAFSAGEPLHSHASRNAHLPLSIIKCGDTGYDAHGYPGNSNVGGSLEAGNSQLPIASGAGNAALEFKIQKASSSRRLM